MPDPSGCTCDATPAENASRQGDNLSLDENADDTQMAKAQAKSSNICIPYTRYCYNRGNPAPICNSYCKLSRNMSKGKTKNKDVFKKIKKIVELLAKANNVPTNLKDLAKTITDENFKMLIAGIKGVSYEAFDSSSKGNIVQNEGAFNDFCYHYKEDPTQSGYYDFYKDINWLGKDGACTSYDRLFKLGAINNGGVLQEVVRDYFRLHEEEWAKVLFRSENNWWLTKEDSDILINILEAIRMMTTGS